jgi:hypothetical protein
MPSNANPPRTPDGRYIVVKGRLWRCSDPRLSGQERQRRVNGLMDARRAVGRARKAGDPDAESEARARVDQAKRALGERGPVWWYDGAPDYTQCKVESTPYAEWYARLDKDGVDPGS